VGTVEDRAFVQRMQRIEGLIQAMENHPDPAAQALSRELVQSLLELHEAGLAKILAHTAGAGEAGQTLGRIFAADPLIGSLLLLHGLHPEDLETRVRRALERVQRALQAQGSNVELVAVAEGAVRLRLNGRGKGCPSSAQAIRQTVEEAVYAAAPDLTLLEIEQAEAQPEGPHTTFIPREQLRRVPGARSAPVVP
jgi:Fe-S cluster biogenesis protein NfuA